MSFYIIAAVICIVLSAFFSGSEMSLSSANRLRLENMAEDGNRSAAMAVKLIDRFDHTLSAILGKDMTDSAEVLKRAEFVSNMILEYLVI